jgi:predicted TIM-barrel fold metal-dependent hydrolase
MRKVQQTNLTRRDLLRMTGAGLVGATGALAYPVLAQQRRRIDIHHHWHPPPVDWAFDNVGIGPSWIGNGWTVNGALELLDRFDIDTAILSIRNPRLQVPVDLCRVVNELATEIVGNFPERFGALAFLPQFDVDAATEEAIYALDTLSMDGIGLNASANNLYLGAEEYDPLMTVLNNRNAVVLIHPTAPFYFTDLNLDLRPSVIEYVFESTRAIANLIVSGTLEQYPNIRFISPHAGGAAPYLAARIQEQAQRFDPSLETRLPRGILESLKSFYFGTAQATSVYALKSLLELVDPSRILFGTDLPVSPPALVEDSDRVLNEYDGLTSDDLERISSGNALELFPRFL